VVKHIIQLETTELGKSPVVPRGAMFDNGRLTMSAAITPGPQREACPQKQELAKEIHLAICAIVAIHNEEFEAVLQGDFNAGEETQLRLKKAREFKTLCIERYRHHLEGHGC